jgi:iron only hydrogenase large subunit-like protein
MKKSVDSLSFPLKGKYLAMLAPSFVVDFQYPKIISQLNDLGFEKVVELTFGAKMINRDYHKQLENSKNLIISSVCPGIVETIRSRYPKYKKNLISIDSPMSATAKICKKTYPSHKVVFISPCNFKKIEAQNSTNIDYVICYNELLELFEKHGISKKRYKKKDSFDKFYNDYTKIYPLSGGLSKTSHLKNILKEKEAKILDGIGNVEKFLKNPDKEIRFLDVTFCKGGCIGGPCISSKTPLLMKKRKVLKYASIAEKERISQENKGLIKRAEKISFVSEYPNK